MKLKQRVVIMGAIAVSFLLSMICVTYYHVQSYPTGVTSSPVDPLEDQLSRMKMRLAEKDKLRPLRRKLKKNRSMVTPNSSVSDSNRAVEMEMNDTEYEDVLKKREGFVRILYLPSSTPPKAAFRSRLSPRFPGLTPECSDEEMRRDAGQGRQKFPDLLQFLDPQNPPKSNSRKVRLTIQEIHGIENTSSLSSLDQFHVAVSDLDLYSEDDPNVEVLLDRMATQPIVQVVEKEGGTQLKLILTFQDGSQALFKPMRFDRDKETEPDHFYFVDYERHVSEIAAFHLDRILGFRRCPPVVGRKLNITSEIYALADDELIKTFFISPARELFATNVCCAKAQNVCFHGSCSYYCDTSHALCGRPDTLEGSLAAFLPPDSLSGRKSWKNPWRRSYHKRRKADFEKNPKHCEVVRERPLYRNSKRLADLVDTSILDFLIGNMDRHHYETFKIFGNDSFIIHLDHGRGFGKPNHDEVSILAPLYQCCFVSFATFERLVQLQHGQVRLSSLMRCSLSRDPLSPILLEKHLRALDRRLEVVLRTIKDCLQNHGSEAVFYKDSLDWTRV